MFNNYSLISVEILPVKVTKIKELFYLCFARTLLKESQELPLRSVVKK